MSESSRREASRRSSAKRRREKPDVVRATNARYRERNRNKTNARALIGKRIERGQLVRPTACEECGRQCKPQAHHPDHSKPLEVRWLCRDCHWKVEATAKQVSR